MRQNKGYWSAIAPRTLAAAAMALALGGAATAAGPLQIADTGRPVAVATTGSVPDLAQQELPGYVAAALNANHLGPWRFEASHPGAASAGYRVVWSFKENAYAAGSVRTYGFSRAQMQRLVGSRNSLTIEARLFLDGEYQTLVLGHATLSEGARSPELTQAIVKIGRELMAYPDLDTKSAVPAKRSGS
jgi:hypothetical protein